MFEIQKRDITKDRNALPESQRHGVVLDEASLWGLDEEGERRRKGMIRVIKRYESRKLYDTEESRYISLEDISRWVREGQEIRVIDNATSEDVTPQILTQIILDEGKRGTSFLPTELLHDLVRMGEQAVSSRVGQVQEKVDRLVQSSIDRLAPVRRAREEMSHLRDRLGELERTLGELESSTSEPAPTTTARAASGTTAKKAAPRKTASRRTSKKTTAKAAEDTSS